PKLKSLLIGMNQYLNHALKMILSHNLIFSFSKQYMVLQSECLRVNLKIRPLPSGKPLFMPFAPRKRLFQ
ncbi:hypothetical protein ACLDWC_18005, partial [Acinetobacter baumannii]